MGGLQEPGAGGCGEESGAPGTPCAGPNRTQSSFHPFMIKVPFIKNILNASFCRVLTGILKEQRWEL